MTTKHLFITAAVATLAIASAASALAQPGSDAGQRDWEVGPSLAAAPSALSRDAVRAELIQAQRAGLIVNGNTAAERFLFANLEKSALSRAQVHAEALEARRLGLLDGNGEREPRVVTPAQAESIRQAGLRAVGALTLAGRR